MVIDNDSRLAVSFMVSLAKNEVLYGPTVRINMLDIAGDLDIGRSYTESLAAKMVAAGLIIGKRGKHGGYKLSRPAEEITVLQIMEAMDPDDPFCTGNDQYTTGAFNYLVTKTRAWYRSITLFTLCNQG